MSEQNDETKEHEPTQKKIEDARKKGEVPRPSDLNTAAGYAGFLLVMTAGGAASVVHLGNIFSALIARSNELATDIFSGHGQPAFAAMMTGVGIAIGPWFLVPALASILSVVAQRSFVAAPSKLKPKANRISLISNAKNKFGRSGLFEFSKSFGKLLIFSVVLGIFLLARTDEVIGTLYLDPISIAATMARMSLSFLFIVLAIALGIGVVDFMWQSAEHIRKHRMSRKELTDEGKQTEGDPHIKQQRRQRAYEIAMNQMLADVPSADVIIVNPTHYAVALKWSRDKGSAPVCVAMGVDEIAARIREIANESAVPIHRDPPTARAIHATVGIGQEVRPEHYRAVAAAIRFAEAMVQKSKGFQ